MCDRLAPIHATIAVCRPLISAGLFEILSTEDLDMPHALDISLTDIDWLYKKKSQALFNKWVIFFPLLHQKMRIISFKNCVNSVKHVYCK